MNYHPLESYVRLRAMWQIVATFGCFSIAAYFLVLAHQSESDRGSIMLYLLFAVGWIGAGYVFATRIYRRTQREILSIEANELRGERPGFRWTLDLNTVERASFSRKGRRIAKIFLVSPDNSLEIEGYERMEELWEELSQSLGSHYFREGESGAWQLRR